MTASWGQTILVSAWGGEAADEDSHQDSLSDDGQYVAFSSDATNLVAGDSNNSPDVFIFNRRDGSIARVSVSGSGGQATGNTIGAGMRPAVSGDGRYIFFSSSATNLVAGDMKGGVVMDDVFLRDRGALDIDPSWRGGAADNPYTVIDRSEQESGRIGLPDYRVNTASLDLVVQGTLFSMNTRAVPIAIRLTYNASPSRITGVLGKGWRLNYESFILFGAQSAQVHLGGGKVLEYTSATALLTSHQTSPLELSPPPRTFDRLLFYGDYWLLKDRKSKITRRYDLSTVGGVNIAYLTALEDRSGNTVTLDVNLANGLSNAITGPAGRSVTFTYTNNLLTKIDTPTGDGRSISLAYNDSSQLVKITDMAGYVGAYEYDGANYMTKLTLVGRATLFSYADRGWGSGKYLTEVDEGAAGKTRYEVVGTDPVRIRRISRNGKTTILTSQDGLTRKIVDPLEGVREISYLEQLPVQVTDANGKIVRSTYDNRGNLTRLEDALGRATDLAYDANDNLISLRNPLGETWYYAYDGSDRLISVRSPLQTTFNPTQMTYDTYGQLTGVRDPNGHQNAFSYDRYGNRTGVTDALDNRTDYFYDGPGLRCNRIVDARGNTKLLEYDDNDHLTRIVYGPAVTTDAPAVRNVFDGLGQIERLDELGRRTAVQRNRFGYITRLIPPLGAAYATDYEYDADNRRTAVIDPLNRRTATAYDEAGRLSAVTDPLGYQVKRTYDAEGNLKTLQDQRGNLTTFIYDANNRLTSTQYPGGAAVAYTRDALGRITGTGTARGDSVEAVYDADGRRTAVKHNGAVVGAFTYDAAGNLLTLTDAGGTTAYTRNARNDVTSITYPGGQVVTFAYNATGQISSMTYPGGIYVTYDYDAFNRVQIPTRFRNGQEAELFSKGEKPARVTSITWSAGSITYAYDKRANMTRRTLPNGMVTDYSYDANNRLNAINHSREGPRPF